MFLGVCKIRGGKFFNPPPPPQQKICIRNPVSFSDCCLFSTEAEVRDDLHQLEQKRFSLADLDNNGRLNQEEFAAFANPSHHEHMMDHLIQEQLKLYDKDEDGYIGFDEYMGTFVYECVYAWKENDAGVNVGFVL